MRPTPALATERLRLRERTPDDAEALFPIFADAVLMTCGRASHLRRSSKTRIKTLEGRLRGEGKTHIGVRDTLLWGLLAEDWARRDAAAP